MRPRYNDQQHGLWEDIGTAMLGLGVVLAVALAYIAHTPSGVFDCFVGGVRCRANRSSGG